ncbi:hypothetical protein VPH35_031327 [Triticum aestivum]
MYMKALECVVLGDSNVKCFYVFMAVMKEVYATLLPLSVDKDGMELADKEKQQQIVAETQHESVEANVVLHKDTGDGESSCSGVGVNEKKRQRGSLTTSRDKAPYEQQLKTSQFCTICREQGQVYNLPTTRRFTKGSKEIAKMHTLWGGWTSAQYLRH